MAGTTQRDDNIIPFAPARARLAPVRPPAPLGDMQFRRLLGAAIWEELPLRVRQRFSKRLHSAASVVYSGEVIECRMNRAGWCLSQALRLVGAPLPLSRDILVPAIVTVTEDEAEDGQFWMRQYGRHKGFPQVIHSAKRFAGPTGLEEYIGGGIGVALRLAVVDQALLFISDHYFIKLGRHRLPLPRWLAPGRLTVSHTDCDHGWFAFGLTLEHPLFGTLAAQTALFRDP